MKRWKRYVCLLLTMVLTVQVFSARADDAYVMDTAGLAEAWALTGLDDDAAPYREGMPFSAQMNARQMEMWLDELLSEEMTALQHMHSQMETALAEMKADQPALYAQMTEGANASSWQQMKDQYNQAENLRQRLRWCRDELSRASGVIYSQKDRIGNPDYSLSQQLTASRETESAVETIQDIRAELAENAEAWVGKIKGWYARMTGGAAANDLGAEAYTAWVDAVLASDAKQLMTGSVPSSALRSGTSNALLTRLTPTSRILGDTSETVTVTVVDAESICFSVVSEEDGSPMPDTTITVTDLDHPAFSETLVTTETGAVLTNANKYTPDEYADLNLQVRVSPKDQQDFLMNNVQMKKGDTLSCTSVQNTGIPYVYSASFNGYDILKTDYCGFYSKKNDMEFPIRIVTDQPCNVTLTYTWWDGQKMKTQTKSMEGGKTVPCTEAGYEKKYETVITKAFKSIIEPYSEVSVTLTAGEGENQQSSTTPLRLKLVPSHWDEPLTDPGNFMDLMFAGMGTGGVQIPSHLFGPLGGMNINAKFPWEEYFSIRGVYNIDGSFVISVGFGVSPVNEKLKKLTDRDGWRTYDQKELDRCMANITKTGFARQQEVDSNVDAMNQTESHHHPLLGSFDAKLSVFALFAGQSTQKTTDGYEFEGKGSFGAMLTFGFHMQYFLYTPPPVFLDLSIGLYVTVGFSFSFGFHRDGTAYSGLSFRPDKSGFTITVRLNVSLGVSFRFLGAISFTLGGFFYIQLSFVVAFDGHVDLFIDLGGGVFLDVTVFWFSAHWNIYDSGSIRVYPKQSSSNRALPWYDDMLSSARDGETETENLIHSMVPEDYDELELQTKTEMENFQLGDGSILFEDINGDTWMFYLTSPDDSNPSQLAGRNMRTGKTQMLAEGGQGIYSFDVRAQLCGDDFSGRVGEYWKNRDLVMLAWTSTSGFTEKESGGEGKTLQVPNDTTLSYCLFTTEDGDTIVRDLPVRNTWTGETGTQKYEYSTKLDRTMGNVQLAFVMNDQGEEDSIVLVTDAVGDKTAAEHIRVLSSYRRFDTMFAPLKDDQLRDFMELPPDSDSPVTLARMCDRTPYYNKYSRSADTIYRLQGGTLHRTDCVWHYSETNDLVIADGNVSFFTVIDDPDHPNQPHIFWLETEPQAGDTTGTGTLSNDSGSSGGTAILQHLKASHLVYNYDESTYALQAYQDQADLDVTVPTSSFEVQLIGNTIYLYWLETGQKEKDSDPDVFLLRGVAYDPDSMTASDDFILAQFTDPTGARPAHVFLSEEGRGYYTRWNAGEEKDSATVLSFPYRLVSHVDLRGMTSDSNTVRAGTDLDMKISVMNDGNTNISELNLEVVLTDQDGHVIDEDGHVVENPDGSEVIEKLHMDFVEPKKSKHTVYGDAASDTDGEHAIYRSDHLADPPVQSRFNITRKTTAYEEYPLNGYIPQEQDPETTSITSSHLLPGQTITLTAAVHIPATWSDTKHITLRLADQQENGLTGFGEDMLQLDHSIHDLDLGSRVYTGPGGAEYLAITIYNHSETRQNLHLYAEMYLDNSGEPISVDLPYKPEYTASRSTQTINMPVSALLENLNANKVELVIKARGIQEPTYFNNRLVFYPSEYRNPLRITEQPVSTTVKEGETAVFTLTADGGAKPYAYQWQVETGTDQAWKDLPGETNRVLTLQNAQLSQNGTRYRCIVTDRALSRVESVAVSLTVIKDVPQTGDNSNPVLWLIMILIPMMACGIMLLRKRKAESGGGADADL